MENFSLYINGVLRTVCVPPQWTLLRVLRETLGLTGAKNGCSSGDCGACRVILDGTAVNACKVPIKDAAGHRVETIEGLSRNGQLHPIQQAFIDCGAVQCGFCTPGMVMSAKALLDKTLHPSDEEIREALAPNLCRCTGYYKIEEAVREAARRLEAHITDIDYDVAAQREREVRHDVMAHIYAYGKAAPSAAGVLHLGATSCYVTDNADLILYRDGLVYLRAQLLTVLNNLAAFAKKYADTPALGYTHYQPAQPVTVGKRAVLWMQDFLADVEELDHVLSALRFLGCRGTTGTEASFMDLFDGNEAKIDEMNRRIAAEFGFSACFPVCGQTYPRKTDSRILGCLSGIAQSAYRMANDIRLLQHDRQLEEPFEADQIGSSAMAYKRNPMRCERICSLSRYMIADAMNAPMTASVQWLERTLDDSANRRIAMPEGFLCIDAVLRLCQNVTAGLHVNEAIVDRTLREYLPFLATEDLMMEAVKRGGDRQQLHEVIRRHSMAATKRMKEGLPCDLLDRLAGDPVFGLSRSELEQLMEPRLYIGRCPQQVRKFLDACTPLLRQAQAADGDIRI